MAINWIRGLRRIGWIATTVPAAIGSWWAGQEYLHGVVDPSIGVWMIVLAISLAFCIGISAMVIQGSITILAWIVRGFQTPDRIDKRRKDLARRPQSQTLEIAVVSLPQKRFTRIRRWVRLYGWYNLLCGICLIVIALIGFNAGQSNAVAPYPYGWLTVAPMLSALFLGLLWGASGVALIHRHRYALRLVWAVVILSAFVVLARRLIPLDTICWLLTLSLAIWFSKSMRCLAALEREGGIARSTPAKPPTEPPQDAVQTNAPIGMADLQNTTLEEVVGNLCDARPRTVGSPISDYPPEAQELVRAEMNRRRKTEAEGNLVLEGIPPIPLSTMAKEDLQFVLQHRHRYRFDEVSCVAAELQRRSAGDGKDGQVSRKQQPAIGIVRVVIVATVVIPLLFILLLPVWCLYCQINLYVHDGIWHTLSAYQVLIQEVDPILARKIGATSWKNHYWPYPAGTLISFRQVGVLSKQLGAKYRLHSDANAGFCVAIANDLVVDRTVLTPEALTISTHRLKVLPEFATSLFPATARLTFPEIGRILKQVSSEYAESADGELGIRFASRYDLFDPQAFQADTPCVQSDQLRPIIGKEEESLICIPASWEKWLRTPDSWYGIHEIVVRLLNLPFILFPVLAFVVIACVGSKVFD